MTCADGLVFSLVFYQVRLPTKISRVNLSPVPPQSPGRSRLVEPTFQLIPRLSGWDTDVPGHPSNISLRSGLHTHPLLDYRDHDHDVVQPQAQDQPMIPPYASFGPEDAGC
jgi:hypothetical protein